MFWIDNLAFKIYNKFLVSISTDALLVIYLCFINQLNINVIEFDLYVHYLIKDKDSKSTMNFTKKISWIFEVRYLDFSEQPANFV